MAVGPAVSQLPITPDLQALEFGKFVDLGNGTTISGTVIPAVRVSGTVSTGASGYSEGTTIGTITAQGLLFRSTGGTLRAVGTQYPLPVQEMFMDGFVDNTNNVAAVARKPVAAAAYSPDGTFYVAGSAAVGTVLKTTAGVFLGASVTNALGTIRYLQIHNGTVRPATGGTPIYVIPVPIGASGDNPGVLNVNLDDLGGAGIFCSAGVSFGISTAFGTFAESGTASHVSSLLWK